MLAHLFHAYNFNKRFDFCCFRASAYTTLDRPHAVFFYIILLGHSCAISRIKMKLVYTGS